jgi:protein-tyrosine phosphatase
MYGMPEPLRHMLRALKRTPERLAHPARRAIALRRLRAIQPFDELVFICHGNVCRSPFAAALVRSSDVERRLNVSSAGFIGPGRTAPAEAIAAASRCGVDLRTHESRLFTSVTFTEHTVVFVMNALQRRSIVQAVPPVEDRVFILGDLDPMPISTREIRDPWGGSASEFDASYARVARCVAALGVITAR